MGTKITKSILKGSRLLVVDVVSDQGDEHLGRGQPCPQPGGQHSAGGKAVASLHRKQDFLQLFLPCGVQWWRGTLTERSRSWSDNRQNVNVEWGTIRWGMTEMQTIESRSPLQQCVNKLFWERRVSLRDKIRGE